MTSASMAEAPIVPELGPLLGRLADPSIGGQFEAIRFALVTELFELAAAARDFAASGDVASATAALGRRAWLTAWERAVGAVAESVATRLDARMLAAARESRMPVGRLTGSRLDDEERRAIRVRLGVPGGPLVAALDGLEAAVPAAIRSRQGLAHWTDTLAAVARRLESAWLALLHAAREEELAWDPEIAGIRAWRRPRWLLWIITLVVLVLAAYLGAVLGGFVATPALLRPFADFWWAHF